MGAQSQSGVNLRVIKTQKEIDGDSLMELHHALGQRVSHQRHDGRTRGEWVLSVDIILQRHKSTATQPANVVMTDSLTVLNFFK